MIEKAAPGAFVWDSILPGFGLRVTAAGSRSFIVQFRTLGGSQGRTTIGRYPALTVDEARGLARSQLGLVEQGHHPSATRRSVRAAPTLRDRADHYCNEYARAANLRASTVTHAKQLLERHALPALGSRKIADITASDIQRLHGATRQAAGPYQANHLVAVLSRICVLAIRDDLRSNNPCQGLTKFPEDQRWRNFSDEEVKRLLTACASYPHQNAMNAIRLLLFTGARLREVTKAEWSQFDIDVGVWTKPSSHTKTKRQHRLELDGPALDLLRAMRLQDPEGRFLFPGRDAPRGNEPLEADLRRPRSDLKRPWQWLLREAQLKDARIHDLRRTTASFMLDEEVPIATIGKALGHTQLATTTRYAQLRQHAQRAGLRKAADRMVALVAI
jgi:integrase